jgi:hypothetical protein
MSNPYIRLRTVIIIATAILLGFTDLTAWGQNPHQGSISLGSVTLVLGMPQDAAMAALAARYSLTHLGNTGNSFLVRNNNGSPDHVFGSVDFTDGKLTLVNKSWGPDNQQKKFDFATRLFWALNELTEEASSNCRIEIRHGEDADGDSKSISFRCGEKSVSIHAIRLDKYNESSAFIDEEIPSR